jgi:geranylgeranyl diphosphate synthase, type I
MDIPQILKELRPPIEGSLKAFFSIRRKPLARVNRWGADLPARLLEFSLQGKMIRGCLITLSYRMFVSDVPPRTFGPETIPPWVSRIAAAYELVHSSLLVHDDIMDRDALRRGKATIYSQYAEAGKREGIGDADRFGESLGICAGDVGFFLAFEMLAGPDPALSHAEPGAGLIRSILRLWSNELTSVGLAQMEDVALSFSEKKPGEPEVLSLYRHKTARYTFSLPLMTGALAAGRGEDTVERLAELGEHLGIIFQIKDDELGIFGAEEEIGKPLGSDLREGKKTLLSLRLAQACGDEYRKTVLRVLGAGLASPPRLAPLRELAERSGVMARLREMCGELKKKAEAVIELLEIDERSKALMRGLLAYNLERKR